MDPPKPPRPLVKLEHRRSKSTIDSAQSNASLSSGSPPSSFESESRQTNLSTKVSRFPSLSSLRIRRRPSTASSLTGPSNAQASSRHTHSSTSSLQGRTPSQPFPETIVDYNGSREPVPASVAGPSGARTSSRSTYTSASSLQGRLPSQPFLERIIDHEGPKTRPTSVAGPSGAQTTSPFTHSSTSSSQDRPPSPPSPLTIIHRHSSRETAEIVSAATDDKYTFSHVRKLPEPPVNPVQVVASRPDSLPETPILFTITDHDGSDETDHTYPHVRKLPELPVVSVHVNAQPGSSSENHDIFAEPPPTSSSDSDDVQCSSHTEIGESSHGETEAAVLTQRDHDPPYLPLQTLSVEPDIAQNASVEEQYAPGGAQLVASQSFRDLSPRARGKLRSTSPFMTLPLSSRFLASPPSNDVSQVRRDGQNWTGEWNRNNLQVVIQELRTLK